MRPELEYAKQIAYSSEETLLFSFDMAQKYAYTDGVYVECGVAAGAQIIAMAKGAPGKIIYAFDSFQGIPLPSNKDDQYPGIRKISKEEQSKLPNPGEQILESSGATSVSEQDFIDNLKHARVNLDNIRIVPGWFEHTAKLFGSLTTRISILRLDGDLYHSTFVCLRNLFPNVIKGGCVIIDDWELEGCREACEYYFESIGYKPEYKRVSNICYFIK